MLLEKTVIVELGESRPWMILNKKKSKRVPLWNLTCVKTMEMLLSKTSVNWSALEKFTFSCQMHNSSLYVCSFFIIF